MRRRCVCLCGIALSWFDFHFSIYLNALHLFSGTATEAERRFKSIREKYRRRKILLERDTTNNVEHSKLKRWDLYSNLGFLDDFMIPRKYVSEDFRLTKLFFTLFFTINYHQQWQRKPRHDFPQIRVGLQREYIIDQRSVDTCSSYDAHLNAKCHAATPPDR